MTEAEQRLLDEVLRQAGLSVTEDPSYYSPIRSLADAVLQERMPPEFERNIQDLADRFVTAQEGLWDYAKRHPLGKKMAGEALSAARRARGIGP